MPRVKFYGIICHAKITDEDFELIGKYRFTQTLLNAYRNLIFCVKDFNNWVLSLFGVESDIYWKIEVIDEDS